MPQTPKKSSRLLKNGYGAVHKVCTQGGGGRGYLICVRYAYGRGGGGNALAYVRNTVNSPWKSASFRLSVFAVDCTTKFCECYNSLQRGLAEKGRINMQSWRIWAISHAHCCRDHATHSHQAFLCTKYTAQIYLSPKHNFESVVLERTDDTFIALKRKN